jgi:hypothetical protein
MVHPVAKSEVVDNGQMRDNHCILCEVNVAETKFSFDLREMLNISELNNRMGDEDTTGLIAS